MIRKAITGIAVACAIVLGLTPRTLGHGPCEKCAEGPNWIDTCPGTTIETLDLIPASAVRLGIDLAADDCTPDLSLVFSGAFKVSRTDPSGGVIDTEIVEMVLTSPDGTMLIAGKDEGLAGVLQASTGRITEDPGDNTIGQAFFNVWFEIELPSNPGTYYYNHAPLIVEADITCIPPTATFKPVVPCIDVYDAPPGVRGAEVVYQVTESGDVVDEQLLHIVVRPTVECDGDESQGSGENSCGDPLRYTYPVTDPEGTVSHVFIGTDDWDDENYLDWCQPDGWSYAIEDYPARMAHKDKKTPHGLWAGSQFPGGCHYVIHWYADSVSPGLPGGKFTFGFNNNKTSHDVTWKVVDDVGGTMANWNEPVGLGEGPVHAPLVPIPAVSQWGLVVMLLLVLAAGTIVIRRRRAAVA